MSNNKPYGRAALEMRRLELIDRLFDGWRRSAERDGYLLTLSSEFRRRYATFILVKDPEIACACALDAYLERCLGNQGMMRDSFLAAFQQPDRVRMIAKQFKKAAALIERYPDWQLPKISFKP